MDTITKALIEAVINFGAKNCWNDTEIVDILVMHFGLKQIDFINGGFAEFTRNYFEND